MFLGSLRGLRIQLMVWTVLPLTLILIAVAVVGISTHERSMRELVEELDARSARLAAAHLSDGLTERVALLEVLATRQDLTGGDTLEQFFDGGVAVFDSRDSVSEPVTAYPSVEVWQARPSLELLAKTSSAGEGQSDWPVFSPIFVDPISGRDTLLIAVGSKHSEMVVGAVSLRQLGLTGIENQVKAATVLTVAEIVANEESSTEAVSEPALMSGDSPGANEAIAFLVDDQGKVIYHPDPGLVGQNWQDYEGVEAVLRGEAGATYHQEADGQELVVGYAPVVGPGWGLIVQNSWALLIAPAMRLSLLAPLVVVLAALVSGLATTFGLRYIVRPLQVLDRQATAIAWGDFSAINEPVDGVQEIKDLRRTLAGMAEQIQRYQTGMRDYVAAVTMAQEEERKRLARELHDETVQSLIALGHRVEMVEKAMAKDPLKARQRLAELRVLTGDVQQEVRRFSRALRPLYLEDLGFVPALEMLVQEMSRDNGLSISLQVEGEVRRLATDLELTAYRIAQEGLSNVVRHAEAQSAWLTVMFTTAGLTLGIRDDGRGFDPPVNPADLAPQGCFGLMGLRERALLFGGWLEVQSKPGQGTSLEVFLPLNQKD